MAIYQWNLAQLHFGRKSMKYGIILTEIWQTKNNWKKWQRINESWHTSELGIKVKLCQNFHFHLFDMIWEPLELEESKYSAKSVVVDNVGPNNKFGRVQWSWSGDRCWVFLAGLYLCISVFSFDQSINSLFNYATP